MFDWIPFYEELADKLLDYKDKPNKLAEIIYDNFDRKTEIKFLHDWDGSDFEVIDPFTIFSIFNRQNKNRHKILEKIREVFNINAETPTSFEGIALQNNLNAAFYCFKQDRSPDGQDINRLWTLFENIITMSNKIEEAFNAVLKQRYIAMPKLTMALSYIRPNNYLALDSNNVSYLEKHKLSPQEALDGGYSEYIKLLTNVRKKIATQEIKEQTFPEISEAAWKYGHNMASLDRKVWLFDAKYEPFESNEIAMGDSVQMSDFSQFKSKEALRKAYQEKKGNTDVSIPNAYWQFIKEVNVGDIIVVYDGVKKDKSAYHKLCGWGIFTSDIIYENGVNALIKRKVEWKRNISNEPIICRETKNQLFFHKANSKQAQAIIKLLEIPEETTSVEQSKEDIEMEYRDLINLLRYKKNIIIQGAPGVGKTYDLYKIIPYLCFPDLKDSSEENLRYLFNKLKEEKRIQYVTFHQSMDYEEFIEGIRPKIDGDDDVTYEIKSGIFKDICTEARKLIVKESKLPLLNNNATIWKVSLARTGDNEVRKECMDNNHIRIGWDDYGSDLSQELEKGKDGRVVLKSFYDTMKIGDIVFSCYSSRIIDAIGIISGEVEWHDEYSEYKRVRKVEWLVKNIREDIYEINNQTNMTLATVYKLNSISLDNVFAILNKHGYKTTASTQKNSNPYILVIDEINRGNISKIFGELISLIEADKREGKEAEIKLNLPYSKELFSVPDNLYIIGTMNTADRSLDTLDYAMRRRFSFVKFYPKKLVTNGFNEELFRNVSRLFIKNFDEFMSNPNTSIFTFRICKRRNIT